MREPSFHRVSERIVHEAKILSTLLINPWAYKELPEDFNSEWFECPEYRDLFNRFRDEFIATGKEANFVELGKTYRDSADLMIDITMAGKVNIKHIRQEAERLRVHRLLDGESSVNSEKSRISYQDSKQLKNPKLKFLSGTDIVSMELPQANDLITNLMRAQSLNFLAGEAGCGKSLLAMNLALSVAVGSKKFLCYDLTGSGKVLYLNNELYFNEHAGRFRMMIERLPARGDISNFVTPVDVPLMDDCFDELNNFCEHEKPCLVVLDCLYYSHNQDENGSSKMKAMMRKLQSLRDNHNLCVIVVHHSRKGARYDLLHNDLMRGAGVFGAAADTILMLKRSQTQESKRILKPTKLRHSADENRKARLLSLDPENLWFRDDGEADEREHLTRTDMITANQVIEFEEIFGSNQELPFKNIVEACEPFGYGQKTVQRQIKDALAKGTLRKIRHGVYALPDMDNMDIP
jgi:hypothetical protein